MKNLSENTVTILWCLFLLVVIICVPLISIWSINTVFSLNIAYSLSTWFGAFWLSAVTLAAKGKSK